MDKRSKHLNLYQSASSAQYLFREYGTESIKLAVRNLGRAVADGKGQEAVAWGRVAKELEMMYIPEFPVRTENHLKAK